MIAISQVPAAPSLAEQVMAFTGCSGLMRRGDLPKAGSLSRRVYDCLLGFAPGSPQPTATDIADAIGVPLKQTRTALSQMQYDGLVERLPGASKRHPSRWRIN